MGGSPCLLSRLGRFQDFRTGVIVGGGLGGEWGRWWREARREKPSYCMLRRRALGSWKGCWLAGWSRAEGLRYLSVGLSLCGKSLFVSCRWNYTPIRLVNGIPGVGRLSGSLKTRSRWSRRDSSCVSDGIVRECLAPRPLRGATPELPGLRRMTTVGWAREVGHGWLLRKHWAPTTPLFLERRPCSLACSNLMGKASSAKRL